MLNLYKRGCLVKQSLVLMYYYSSKNTLDSTCNTKPVTKPPWRNTIHKRKKKVEEEHRVGAGGDCEPLPRPCLASCHDDALGCSDDHWHSPCCMTTALASLASWSSACPFSLSPPTRNARHTALVLLKTAVPGAGGKDTALHFRVWPPVRQFRGGRARGRGVAPPPQPWNCAFNTVLVGKGTSGSVIWCFWV